MAGFFFTRCSQRVMEGVIPMTTLHTSPNGNRLHQPADQPGNVAIPTASYQPAAAVELPAVEHPNPADLDFRLYLHRVLRPWEPVSLLAGPPECGPGMDYVSAAEITAAYNRQLIRRDIERGKKKNCDWTVCVRRQSNFVPLRIAVKPWKPIDEFDLPPAYYSETCTRKEIRNRIAPINSVLSKLYPNRKSMFWIVATVPIHPEYVQDFLNRKSQHEQWQPLFNVTTASGITLYSNLTGEAAQVMARHHAAANPHPDHQVKIVQAN